MLDQQREVLGQMHLENQVVAFFLLPEPCDHPAAPWSQASLDTVQESGLEDGAILQQFFFQLFLSSTLPQADKLPGGCGCTAWSALDACPFVLKDFAFHQQMWCATLLRSLTVAFCYSQDNLGLRSERQLFRKMEYTFLKNSHENVFGSI